MVVGRCDAVVVGAGPAGLVAAARLARDGHRVALIDRDEAPPVGPLLLTQAGLDVLSDLGWLEAVRGLSGVVSCRSLVLESDRETVELDGFGEMVAVERGIALAEMRRLAMAGGVEMLFGWTVAGPVWEGRKVVGVRARDEGGEERVVTAPAVIDASGPSSVIGGAVGQLLPRRGPSRLRLTAALCAGVPAEPRLIARQGVGLLLLPSGHLVATVQSPLAAGDVEGQVRAACAQALSPMEGLDAAIGTATVQRVGSLLLSQAGEGWVAVGEAAGCGASWLPGRTASSVAAAATAGWEVGLALSQRRPLGPGQLGATLALSRQAQRAEMLLDRALVRAVVVGKLGEAAATPWRRRRLGELLVGAVAPLGRGLGQQWYLWWLDRTTRRELKRERRRG